MGEGQCYSTHSPPLGYLHVHYGEIPPVINTSLIPPNGSWRCLVSHFQIKIYEGGGVYDAWHLASFIMDVSSRANATPARIELSLHTKLAELTQSVRTKVLHSCPLFNSSAKELSGCRGAAMMGSWLSKLMLQIHLRLLNVGVKDTTLWIQKLFDPCYLITRWSP